MNASTTTRTSTTCGRAIRRRMQPILAEVAALRTKAEATGLRLRHLVEVSGPLVALMNDERCVLPKCLGCLWGEP